MRISLRRDGKELDASIPADGQAAIQDAMMILVRQDHLAIGDILFVDSDNAADHKATGPVIINAGNLKSLAARLEARAKAIASDQPEGAIDLRTAARLCLHAIKWVGKTSVAVA